MKLDIAGTTVLNGKKTSVLVLMTGLVDRSWSRTVPTLVGRADDVVRQVLVFFFRTWTSRLVRACRYGIPVPSPSRLRPVHYTLYIRPTLDLRHATDSTE